MSGFIGVDEAGRGPVFGSLFVAAVASKTVDDLPDGTADSKTLTTGERRELAEAIFDHQAIETAVVEVTAEAIDAADVSLTELIARAFAEAINGVRHPDATVVTDAGEADVDRFSARVRHHLDQTMSVQARIRADETEPIVSAASIIAKEHRERHIDELTRSYGDIGSGYPSDPTTRAYLVEYLEEHGDVPPFTRRSWQTCKDAQSAYEQASFERFIATGDD